MTVKVTVVATLTTDYILFSVTDKISESMNIIANEPSLAFFRVQEHVRKSLPQLVETKVY